MAVNPTNKVKTDNVLHKLSDNSFKNTEVVLNELLSATTPQLPSDWNATEGVTRILNKPDLKPVATSGSYNDLVFKPDLSIYSTKTELNTAIENIPAQLPSDWNATEGVTRILNKPEIPEPTIIFDGATTGTVPVSQYGGQSNLNSQTTVLCSDGTWRKITPRPIGGAASNDFPLKVSIYAPNKEMYITPYYATNDNFGFVKPDNTTITIKDGVISSSGVSVGTIIMYCGSVPPAGYLICDGAAVGRETYPELFAAIGTTFGEGDGSTTFNLPDMIDRFAQGSNTPGQKIEAGLPSIEGAVSDIILNQKSTCSGAFGDTEIGTGAGSLGINDNWTGSNLVFKASSGVYGLSETVQPPALTLLPCIKAFGTVTNPGLIDISGLAQEMANKTDKSAAAHAAMPSDNYVDLTLPISGGTITVPADGYLLAKLTGDNAGYFSIDSYHGEIYIASHISSYAFGAYFLFCPVVAGNIAKIYNTTSATSELFRFIYANGSVQQ